jgi:hypothetical protein
MMAVEWARKIDFESEKLYYYFGFAKETIKGLSIEIKGRWGLG